MKNPAITFKVILVIVFICLCQHIKAQSGTSCEQKALNFFMDSLYRKKEPFKHLHKLYSEGKTKAYTNKYYLEYSIAPISCLDKDFRNNVFHQASRANQADSTPPKSFQIRRPLKKHKFSYKRSLDVFSDIEVDKVHIVMLNLHYSKLNGRQIYILMDENKNIIKWCESSWVI